MLLCLAVSYVLSTVNHRLLCLKKKGVTNNLVPKQSNKMLSFWGKKRRKERRGKKRKAENSSFKHMEKDPETMGNTGNWQPVNSTNSVPDIFMYVFVYIYKEFSY